MSDMRFEFVEFIPEQLEGGVVYVSTEYATVVHLCCCGCGNEVVTPLSPADWKLTFDGVSISLDPSIGNWSFDCQSHYWIRRNKVCWANQWSEDQITQGRRYDAQRKSRYYNEPADHEIDSETVEVMPPTVRRTRWTRCVDFLMRR